MFDSFCEIIRILIQFSYECNPQLTCCRNQTCIELGLIVNFHDKRHIFEENRIPGFCEGGCEYFGAQNNKKQAMLELKLTFY